MAKKKRKYRTKTARIRLPHFDPEPSTRVALEILRAAKAPFALAGRVAAWLYLPPDEQAYTKDVDFAIPRDKAEQVAAAARAAGYDPIPLDIGGCCVRDKGVAVDFIHRHPELGELFAAAVRAARRSKMRTEVAGHSVPVVPRDYLIAMKIATMEEKDERDAESLILAVPDDEYGKLRSLVRRHLGPVGALRLDVIARRVGHPGAGRRKYYNQETRTR